MKIQFRILLRPARFKDIFFFFPHHRVQIDTGAHPASYTMDIGGPFPWGEAAGAWNWPLISIWRQGEECMRLYLHSSVSLHGVVLV